MPISKPSFHYRFYYLSNNDELPKSSDLWKQHEPNNANNNEGCVATVEPSEGKFMDIRCNRKFYPLCQRPGIVENILKGSLDLIPSPSTSVKIQIMGGKVCLRCKGKILLGFVDKLLKTKSLMTSVLPYYLK